MRFHFHYRVPSLELQNQLIYHFHRRHDVEAGSSWHIPSCAGGDLDRQTRSRASCRQHGVVSTCFGVYSIQPDAGGEAGGGATGGGGGRRRLSRASWSEAAGAGSVGEGQNIRSSSAKIATSNVWQLAGDVHGQDKYICDEENHNT
jgi:hypothetical protein